MKKHLSTLLLFLMVTASAASATESSLILECSGKSENFAGKLQVDAVGKVTLQGKVDRTSFRCELEIETFSYPRQTESDSLTLRMKLQGCQDSSGQPYQNKYLLQTPNIVVQSDKQGGYNATTQWITYLAPNSCAVSKLDRSELSRAAEKFANHSWP